jgi:hypothetical protein
VVRQLADYDASSYGPPTKVTVEYDSGLDLLQMCLCESRGWWEAQACMTDEGRARMAELGLD